LVAVVWLRVTIKCAFHAARMQIVSVMKFREKNILFRAYVKPAKILFLGVDILAQPVILFE
jgi:hypothetical protein